MANLTCTEIAVIRGVLAYHVDLPRIGDSQRAVITLKELLDKEVPNMDEFTQDFIRAYGIRCMSLIDKNLEDKCAAEKDTRDYKKITDDTLNRLVAAYGKEGERWKRA